MTSASHIFLAGASRGVGREIAKSLRAQQLKVTALLRTLTVASELENIGIQVVQGDALNIGDVERAIVTDEPIDTVISTIGGVPSDVERPDYPGNRNLIDAAVKAGIKNFILVSSIGAGDSVRALTPQVLAALGAVLAEKEKAEQHLIASGLTYTIIRPGGLKSEPATGNGVLTEDPTIIGSINRQDVAQLVCRCLNSDAYGGLRQRPNNKILSAVDRNMLFKQTEFAEFSLD
ncbi:MAG: SDR family oxidoreductase [Nostoc sp. ChiSLP02]|nr:SDR family oxidoreductase [Nostoc sp. DedSLP05]MDZ8101058.1 SDR family oxidoreductase [Nostoc sp. DedSLP01]MDZ8188978.1 SDR family oxidoreductase [Nostoc sp. ChiSLP02]